MEYRLSRSVNVWKKTPWEMKSFRNSITRAAHDRTKTPTLLGKWIKLKNMRFLPEQILLEAGAGNAVIFFDKCYLVVIKILWGSHLYEIILMWVFDNEYNPLLMQTKMFNNSYLHFQQWWLYQRNSSPRLPLENQSIRWQYYFEELNWWFLSPGGWSLDI